MNLNYYLFALRKLNFIFKIENHKTTITGKKDGQNTIIQRYEIYFYFTIIHLLWFAKTKILLLYITTILIIFALHREKDVSSAGKQLTRDSGVY